MKPKLTPRLIVPDTAAAIAFYEAAFGAKELERYDIPNGIVVHAAISIDGAVISLADEVPEWKNHSPVSLGGTPVLLTLACEDPDEVAASAIAAGAKIVIPIEDRAYGHREGRIEDPFGHYWILTKVIEELTPEQIRERLS